MAYPCHGCGKMFRSSEMKAVSGYYHCASCFNIWLIERREEHLRLVEKMRNKKYEKDENVETGT